MEKRIEALQKGNVNATGWKLTIDDFDQQELCSEHEIFTFQLKCRYLTLALRCALEDMPDRTWLECCNDALEIVNRTDGIRLFSKRAREYMLAYSILDNNEEMQSSEEVDDKKKPHMTAYLIEKIVKQYKSHRSASDFDAGFIRIVEKMREQQYSNN